MYKSFKGDLKISSCFYLKVVLSTKKIMAIELIMLNLLYIWMFMSGVEMFVLKFSFSIFLIWLLNSEKGIFAIKYIIEYYYKMW